MQLHHENALPEPITIIGNTLYLDQVEAIFISDRERIESLWPDIDLHRNDIFDIMPNG
ncbi:MAG: hypothetical protein FWE11_07865 [Defluviitaleaceae bacterium]|nr:hypothetical protein [Defluviitaleaceae bacterium]